MEKKRILVVDDERDFTEMIKLNLEATGYYEVLIENRGAHALQAALAHRPDLILLDIIMPDVEGPEVYRQIKEHPLLKDTPIVFFTATVTPEETSEHHGHIGGHVFLAKPSSLDELLSCIQDQIKNY